MTNSLVETLIGALVIAVAAVFLVYAYSTAGMTRAGGYPLSAVFSRADGVTTGTDVRIAGIKVGTVTSLALDQKLYQAKVNFDVASDVKVPDDSQIKVASEGLLGGNYLAIEPGGSETYLQAGGVIEYTQGTIDLMSLVSKALFSTAGGGAKSAEPAGNAPAGAPAPGAPSTSP
jgi:phospholipid/cholesterol/gamma-HCH transport system substrate-binding protein